MSIEPLLPTPGQTVGPFFNFGLVYPASHELVAAGTPGAIRLHGTVTDGAGDPVPDALVEIWQPDAVGTVARTAGSILRDGVFTGFGRAETDREGRFWFRTLEPARADGAAFFAVAVFARGLLDRLFTRAYVPSPATTSDPFLASIPTPRRATLIAEREPDGALRWDIVLQGDAETVFLTFDDATAGAAHA
jgi:protocatechuate 3,4-dioxygenase alpha subunit